MVTENFLLGPIGPFESRPANSLSASFWGMMLWALFDEFSKTMEVPFFTNAVVGSNSPSEVIFTVIVPLAGLEREYPAGLGALAFVFAAGLLAQPAPRRAIMAAAANNLTVFFVVIVVWFISMRLRRRAYIL